MTITTTSSLNKKSIFLLLNHVNVCYMLIHISALHKQINLCTKVGDEGIHGCAHERMRQMARTHTHTHKHILNPTDCRAQDIQLGCNVIDNGVNNIALYIGYDALNREIEEKPYVQRSLIQRSIHMPKMLLFDILLK